MKRKISRFIFGTLGVMLVCYAIAFVWLAIQIKDESRASDAVIVLGARVNYNNYFNPCLVARVEHGAKLVKSGLAKFLIVSGGNDVEDGANEASAMREMALTAGISSEQIILEPKATSTFENLKFSQTILEQRQLKSVIVVTEPYHMPRAAMIARKLNLEFSSSPAPESACWSRWKHFSRFFLREPIAVLENWLKGSL
jgi:uncharacterized SAM-binding protein YcdF (DUF218 family)